MLGGLVLRLAGIPLAERVGVLEGGPAGVEAAVVVQAVSVGVSAGKKRRAVHLFGERRLWKCWTAGYPDRQQLAGLGNAGLPPSLVVAVKVAAGREGHAGVDRVQNVGSWRMEPCRTARHW